MKEKTKESVVSHQRLDYVDLFRGFGILLMIMGHIGFGVAFDKFIHAFHMPMFFFVSGFFYKPKEDVKLGVLALRKARSLLIPYLCFAVLHYLIHFLAARAIDTDSLLSLVFNTETPIPISGALWFLTALFFADIIYLLLDRMLKQKWALHIVIFIITASGMLFGSIIPVRLPLAIDAAMVGVGFFHFARTARNSVFFNEMIRLFQMKFWIALLAGAVTTVLIFVNGSVNMRASKYAIYPLSWLIAVLASVIGWNICRYLHTWTANKPIVKQVDMLVVFFGKNSIVSLCLNQLVILIVHKCFVTVGAEAKYFCILELMVVLFLLYLLTLVFTKTRLCVFCGKTLKT